MSTANTSITQRKDRPYVKQTIVGQQNNNNKKSLKEYMHNDTSEYAIVQKQFLICQFCFWCASCYTYDTANGSLKFDISNLAAVQHCPGCGAKGRIQLLPILRNEHKTYGENR